jgi:DNA-binding SARP family transcriptional activator
MPASLPEDAFPPLCIRLFGPLDVRLRGEPLPHLRSRKVHWLLSLLTLRYGREVERTWLAGTLWPESDESHALANLRISLRDLRRALGAEAERLLAPVPRTLCLETTGAEVDVIAFDAAIGRGDAASLEEAVALYHGPLLEGCTEEWVLPEREAREQSYLTALETLAGQAAARGDAETAARYLRRAITTEPSRETAQRALMQALAAGGNYGAANEVYRDLRLYLHRELNAEPDGATKALFEQMRTEARQKAEGRRQKAEGSDPEGRRQKAVGSPDGATAGSSTDTSSRPPSAFCLLPSDSEPAGGAVPLDSPFYLARAADEPFYRAIARRDSIVLVKGARQMGKTSLLGRGLQRARQAGARVVQSELQLLSAADLVSAEAFYLAVGSGLADQLELDVLPHQVWAAHLGATTNFNRYMRREVLSRVATSLVWGLDQVDVLASCDFGTEVFSLLRSWHNQRVTDPDAPWSRLSLVMAYATEAYLFIADANQSPFNVGTRVTLDDFTLEQVADLNDRHGSPLQDSAEIARFYRLVAGHPYLVRRGLHEMAAHGITLPAIEAEVGHDEGIFGDHLRRTLALLARDAVLKEAARSVLQSRPSLTVESFHRLRSAGILIGDSVSEAQPRCPLYAAYLARHLL